jgi:hypothetical protein
MPLCHLGSDQTATVMTLFWDRISTAPPSVETCRRGDVSNSHSCDMVKIFVGNVLETSLTRILSKGASRATMSSGIGSDHHGGSYDTILGSDLIITPPPPSSAIFWV